MWEASGEWDDAYIDYEKAHTEGASLQLHDLTKQLYKTALLSGRKEKANKWKSYLKPEDLHEFENKINLSELVVVFQQGWGPRKYSSYHNAIVPMLRPVSAKYGEGFLKVLDKKIKAVSLIDIELSLIHI